MTSTSEATLNSSELFSPPSHRVPVKACLEHDGWLCLLSAHFTRGLLRQVLVCLLGKCLWGGCTFQGETLWALVWERGSCRGLRAPSLTVSSGSLFTAALGTPRRSLESRNPMDSAQPLEG